jgi:PKD repeat protein
MRATMLRARRSTAVVAVIALTATGLVVGVWGSPAAIAVPGPVVPRADAVVTADALPTVQVDGVVWSQAIVGNTVYVGGSFANARPAGSAPGTNRTARANLLAYNLTTGALITSFARNTNGTVHAVAKSPDGSRLYIGGDFTTVDGQTRQRIAAFDTATGNLVASFAPNVGARVKTIVATSTTVYVGGQFTTVSGQQRSRLVALNPANGAVLAWNPGADYTVNAMVMVPDGSRLIVGGAFQNLGGGPAYGLAAVNPATGGVIAWEATATVRNAGANAAILGLSTDGTYVYGNGYVFGSGGNLEGTFSAESNTGKIRWIEDCHGDTYGNFAVGQTVYTVSHAHYCGNVGGYGESLPRGTHMRPALAFTRDATGTVNPDPRGYPNWAGQPSPSIISWFPEMTNGTYTGQSQAAWTITGNATYVVLGGEFPTVNGVGQQGLVRFAVKPVAPADRGPQLTAGKFVPTLSSTTSGAIRVAFRANHDQDNRVLNYRIVRDGVTTVHQTSVASSFWDRPTIAFTDKVPTPGAAYRYRIFVNDGDGNEVAGDTVTLTATGTGTLGSYADTVINQQGASLYWRFGEASGTSVVDWAGATSGVAGTGVSRGAAGALTGDANTAANFSGTSTGRVYSPTQMPSPASYSASVWFKTTTSSGGKLIGFGDSQTGNSVLTDRHLYMDNSGRLIFGVAPRGVVTITSPRTYRDGQWHQAVTTLGADGIRLYVDGQQVAARADTTSAEDIFGYWRVGGDTIDTTWPSRPTSTFFSGSIDEVAIFPTVLTPAQIADQWSVSRGAPTNAPPVAAFTSSTSTLTAALNATGSTDPDGSIASYSWNFGDGTTGTGATTSHIYPATGTYQVTLTVTDNGGAAASITKPVTVSAANVAPVAAFTSTTAGLTVNVNGTGSADPDGSIASYAWNFGDGSTGTGSTATRSYAAAGTYAVTLTVTDDDGATNATSRQVTVSEQAGPVTIAADTFARTVTGGWGSAAAGGSWTPGGSGSLFATDGAVGTMRMSTAGAGPSQVLGTVSAADLTGSVDLSLDKAPTGTGMHGMVLLHKNGTSDYRIKVRLLPTSTAIQISRVVANAETSLLVQNVPGLTYQLGDTVRFAFRIADTGPETTISGKAWKIGAAEPATWQATAADATASLQGAGAVGLQAYLASSATNAPVVARFDNLTITTLPVP